MKYLGFNPTETSPYYFISYNNNDEDIERVSVILKELNRRQIPMWYDYGIPYGSKWMALITEKIDKCEAVILFYTNKILEKTNSYVFQEYRLASIYGKKIYVVMLDEIDEALAMKKYYYTNWVFNELQQHQAVLAANVSVSKVCDEIMRSVEPRQIRQSINREVNSAITNIQTSQAHANVKKEPTNNLQARNLKKGSTITFGHYPQDKTRTPKPIEWLILDTKPNGDALLISKYALQRKKYHEKVEPATWDSCTLRTWLNNDFYNKAFDANEQTKILTTPVTADRNPKYDTNPGIDKPNKIFLLTKTSHTQNGICSLKTLYFS